VLINCSVVLNYGPLLVDLLMEIGSIDIQIFTTAL